MAESRSISYCINPEAICRASGKSAGEKINDNAPFPLAALVSAGGPRPSEKARPLQRGHRIIHLQDEPSRVKNLCRALRPCSHTRHADETSKQRTRRNNGTETDNKQTKKKKKPHTKHPHNRREKSFKL